MFKLIMNHWPDFVAVGTPILASFLAVLWQLAKKRKIDTLTYLSKARDEIWSISDYRSLHEFQSKKTSESDNLKDKNLSKKDEISLKKAKAIKQKLEYIASAVNNRVISFRLMQNLMGNWFDSAAVRIGIVPQKGKVEFVDPYIETKKLVSRLREPDCFIKRIKLFNR